MSSNRHSHIKPLDAELQQHPERISGVLKNLYSQAGPQRHEAFALLPSLAAFLRTSNELHPSILQEIFNSGLQDELLEIASKEKFYIPLKQIPGRTDETLESCHVRAYTMESCLEALSSILSTLGYRTRDTRLSYSHTSKLEQALGKLLPILWAHRTSFLQGTRQDIRDRGCPGNSRESVMQIVGFYVEQYPKRTCVAN